MIETSQDITEQAPTKQASTEELIAGRVNIRTRIVMFALLGAYLVLSTFYNFAVPVGEAPDEPDHIAYVQILLKTGQFPTIPRNTPLYSYEAEQPPLYYVLQAAWMQVLWPNHDLLPPLKSNPDFSFANDLPANAFLHDYPASDDVPVHLMRFLSTLIGLCALVFIFMAARLAWPDDDGAALIALGFAALLPGFTFTSATVNNDSLAACTGAAILLVSLWMLRKGMHLRIVLLAGLALGLGLLSKRSMLVMLPLVALVCLYAPARDRITRLKSSAILFVVAIAVGVWPFVTNMLTYGDPLATQVTLEAKNAIASPLAHILGFWLVPGYFLGLFNSLWGVFGLRNVEMPGLVYDFYYLLCILALLGVIYTVRHAGRGSMERRIALILASALVLIYAGVAFQNSQLWAIQGRLLLPGLAALVLLLGRGLSRLGAQLFSGYRARLGALAALLSAMFLLNGYALIWHILSIYYP